MDQREIDGYGAEIARRSAQQSEPRQPAIDISGKERVQAIFMGACLIRSGRSSHDPDELANALLDAEWLLDSAVKLVQGETTT